MAELVHFDNLAHVSLDNGPRIRACPGTPALWLFAFEHFWIAADQDGLYQVSGCHVLGGSDQFASEGVLQKRRTVIANLGPR